MKVPSISNITKPIKKGLMATMIAAPAAGTMQSCESAAVAMRNEMYMHHVYHMPYYRPVPPPPVRVYNFYQPPRPSIKVTVTPAPKPPVNTKPGHNPPPRGNNNTPPPKPGTHTNSHGDTFKRGGR